VPNDALLDVSDYYLRFEHFTKEKVIEEKLRALGGGGAAGGGGESFFDAVASASPAPGGGSVASAAGSLAAALTAMVCRLTVGKKAYAEVKEELTSLRDKADDLRAELHKLITTDEEAFNAVMAAFKLPKGTDEQIAARDQAIEEANKKASQVPLEVMKKALEALKLARVVAQKGNQNSITDAGVAGLMGTASVEGARYNVRINLKSIKDEGFVKKMTAESDAVRSEAETVAGEIRRLVEAKL